MSSTYHTRVGMTLPKRLAAEKRYENAWLKIYCLREHLEQLTILLKTVDNLELSTVLSIMVNLAKLDIKSSLEHFDIVCDERLTAMREFAKSVEESPWIFISEGDLGLEEG